MYVSLLLSYFMNVLSFFGASISAISPVVVILIWQIGPIVENLFLQILLVLLKLLHTYVDELYIFSVGL